MKDVINYDLIKERKWKSFLLSLPVGNYSITMPDVKAMKSCKVTGYDLNSDGENPNVYYFSLNKKHKMFTIKVVPRSEARISRSFD